MSAEVSTVALSPSCHRRGRRRIDWNGDRYSRRSRIPHPGSVASGGKHLTDGASDELGYGYAQVARFLLGEGVFAFVEAHLGADHVITIAVFNAAANSLAGLPLRLKLLS